MVVDEMITVAIPVYNGEKFLREALESVIVQSRAVEKIIITDDASIDNSPRIVKELQNKAPEMYKLISDQDYAKL